jgi:hypothetical protein
MAPYTTRLFMLDIPWIQLLCLLQVQHAHNLMLGLGSRVIYNPHALQARAKTMPKEHVLRL